MAFDFKVQKIVKQAGVREEVGILAFATSDVTVEVPTKLTKILAGFGASIGTSAQVPTPVGLADTTVTAGCITMERPAGGLSGASFSYVLYGF